MRRKINNKREQKGSLKKDTKFLYERERTKIE